MRVITSIGFAIELDEQVYMATPLTKAITKPALEGGMRGWWVRVKKFNSQIILFNFFKKKKIRANVAKRTCSYLDWTSAFPKMLEHFSVHGYKCPTDSRNCPYSWAFATDLSYFQHLQHYPEKQRDMHDFMTGVRVARKLWIDWFPVESELLSATPIDEMDDTSTILLVDVGGGKGHDLERFLRQYPQTKGRLVLQDLPGALGTIQRLSSDIHPMPHDFFTPQPIKSKSRDPCLVY